MQLCDTVHCVISWIIRGFILSTWKWTMILVPACSMWYTVPDDYKSYSLPNSPAHCVIIVLFIADAIINYHQILTAIQLSGRLLTTLVVTSITLFVTQPIITSLKYCFAALFLTERAIDGVEPSKKPDFFTEVYTLIISVIIAAPILILLQLVCQRFYWRSQRVS